MILFRLLKNYSCRYPKIFSLFDIDSINLPFLASLPQSFIAIFSFNVEIPYFSELFWEYVFYAQWQMIHNLLSSLFFESLWNLRPLNWRRSVKVFYLAVNWKYENQLIEVVISLIFLDLVSCTPSLSTKKYFAWLLKFEMILCTLWFDIMGVGWWPNDSKYSLL